MDEYSKENDFGATKTNKCKRENRNPMKSAKERNKTVLENEKMEEY